MFVENCTTPNNESAHCISLYNCPVLLRALTTQKPSAIEFVRQSQCGSWNTGSAPTVCCGTSSDFLSDRGDFSEEATKQPLSDTRFCGYQHSDDYFHDKNVIAIDEFPWLAILKYEKDADILDVPLDDFLEFTCAGTLINVRYVLTAAQCLRFSTSSV